MHIATADCHGVDTNILTVVTADTAKNYRKAYNFFVRSGLIISSISLCLDPLDEPLGAAAMVADAGAL